VTGTKFPESISSILNLKSKAQYELQFKKWGFKKYRTADDWKIVAEKVKKRNRESKDSEVYINGALVNPKKLRKETLRYGSTSKKAEMQAQGSYFRILLSSSSHFETSSITSNTGRHRHPHTITITTAGNTRTILNPFYDHNRE
jgi:hypothetical protein